MIQRVFATIFNLVYGTTFGMPPLGDDIEAELEILNNSKQGFTE